jgi:hypothetical protein
MKMKKVTKKRVTLFKIWCVNYEVLNGDPMPIRQTDINQMTKISIPSIHHLWNECGRTSESSINHIYRALPDIIKERVVNHYTSLTPEHQAFLLNKAKLTNNQRKEILKKGQLSKKTIGLLLKSAPILTEGDLRLKTKKMGWLSVISGRIKYE